MRAIIVLSLLLFSACNTTSPTRAYPRPIHHGMPTGPMQGQR